MWWSTSCLPSYKAENILLILNRAVEVHGFVTLMSGSDVISLRFLISRPGFCLIMNHSKMVIRRAP